MTLKHPPWGDLPDFEWADHIIEKVWRKHGVRPEEIKQVFQNPHHWIAPHQKARSEPEKYGTYYEIVGFTDGGRKLRIIVDYIGDDWVFPVTAFEID